MNTEITTKEYDDFYQKFAPSVTCNPKFTKGGLGLDMEAEQEMQELARLTDHITGTNKYLKVANVRE